MAGEDPAKVAAAISIVATRKEATARSALQESEARLRKLRSGVGVLVSVLQRHLAATNGDEKTQAVLAALLTSLGSGSQSATTNGSSGSDCTQLCSSDNPGPVADAGLQHAMVWESAAASYTLPPQWMATFRERESALQRLIQDAQGMQLAVAALKKQRGAAAGTDPVEAFSMDTPWATLLSFISQTLMSTPPSEVRLTYMQAAAQGLAAALHAAATPEAENNTSLSPSIHKPPAVRGVLGSLQPSREQQHHALVQAAADVNHLLGSLLQLALSTPSQPVQSASPQGGQLTSADNTNSTALIPRAEAARIFLSQAVLPQPALGQLLLVAASRRVQDTIDQLQALTQTVASSAPTDTTRITTALSQAAPLHASSQWLLMLVTQCIDKVPSWLLGLPALGPPQEAPAQAPAGGPAQAHAFIVEDEDLSVLGLATSGLLAAHAAVHQPISTTAATSSDPPCHTPAPGAPPQVSAQPLSEVYPLLAQRLRETVVHLASVLQQCVAASAPSTAAAKGGGRPGQRVPAPRTDQGIAGSDQPAVKPGTLLSSPSARSAAIGLCHKLKQALLPSEQM